MDERERTAEALAAAESAYRLAHPVQDRLERAAISGLRIPSPTGKGWPRSWRRLRPEPSDCAP
jgi:hypothetical protein